MRRIRLRWLEVVGASAVALALGFFVLIVQLQQRGRAAMQASDVAFHQGDLPEAIREAEKAMLAYVPASEHVRRAEERLLAIARGAESEQKLQLARSAWEALSVGYHRTAYPGRPAARYQKEAEDAKQRLDRELSRR